MKTKKFLPVIFALTVALSLNGCILDAFDELVQNTSYSIDISSQGYDVNHYDEESFCLPEDSKTMSDYTDRLDKLEFVTASYRNISCSPSNLQGDIKIEIFSGGIKLYEYVLPSKKPSDYTDTPYILPFTQAQIQEINNKLKLFKYGVCFTAKASITNITPGQDTNKSVSGKIDIVWKMTITP